MKAYNLCGVYSCPDDFQSNSGIFLDDLRRYWLFNWSERAKGIHCTCSSDANDGGFELGSKRISG